MTIGSVILLWVNFTTLMFRPFVAIMNMVCALIVAHPLVIIPCFAVLVSIETACLDNSLNEEDTFVPMARKKR